MGRSHSSPRRTRIQRQRTNHYNHSRDPAYTRNRISQTEKEDGGHGCERGSGLQGEDVERLSWRSWQPLDREEQQYRKLPGHEKLPEMGRGPFVRLANKAMPVTENVMNCSDTHNSQSGERHCEGKEGAGGFQDGAKGAGIRFHVASSSREDVLQKRGLNDVCRREEAAGAHFKKRLELLAVALSPMVRI